MGWKFKIRWEKFSLRHHTPAHFGSTQWENIRAASIYYFVYRTVAFAYFYFFLFYNIFHDFYGTNQLPYYLLYLTNWTYLTALLDIALQMVTAIVATVRSTKGKKPVLPVALYRANWLIINISHTMEPFVTALYWSSVYPQIPHGSAVPYFDLHLHLFTTIYTTVDLLVHKCPRRVLHVIYPLCFGVAYLLFTLIYYLCGGRDPSGHTAIYPILDWANPGLTIGVAVGAIIAMFVLHIATWGIVYFRLRMHEKWFGAELTVDVDVAGNDVEGGGDSGGGSENEPRENVAPNVSGHVDVVADVGDKERNKGVGDGLKSRDAGKGEDNEALEMDEIDLTSEDHSGTNITPIA